MERTVLHSLHPVTFLVWIPHLLSASIVMWLNIHARGEILKEARSGTRQVTAAKYQNQLTKKHK
jgi:hypothetical protein